MDSKLPMDIFENVMQLAIEGCKAIAQYIREVRSDSINYMISCIQDLAILCWFFMF